MTQLERALQTAPLTQQESHYPHLVVASLLHDIGYLMIDEHDERGISSIRTVPMRPSKSEHSHLLPLERNFTRAAPFVIQTVAILHLEKTYYAVLLYPLKAVSRSM